MRTTVPSEGGPSAKIILIGEGPGAVEARMKRPFVGPAGGILEECLHAARITRHECYITNVFPFRVHKDGTGRILDEQNEVLWHPKKGFTELGMDSVLALTDELRSLKGTIIVPLGTVALEATTDYKGIYKYRGSPIPSNNYNRNVTIIPAIHPSAVLQGGDYLIKYYIIHDLKKAKKYVDGFHPPIYESLINPSYVEVIQYIQRLINQALPVNFDIEIMNQEIHCISLYNGVSPPISIPFFNKWSMQEECDIWQLLTTLMQDENIPKCNQNILFDMWMLARYGIEVRGRLEDPMIAHSLIYPDFPKSLEFLTSIYDNLVYYKDDGKVWIKHLGKDIDEFYDYNAKDSYTSLNCMEALGHELLSEGFEEIYRETMDLLPVLLYKMIHGIRVNKSSLDSIKLEIESLIEESLKRVYELAGRELNPNSSKQLQQYFYVELDIKPYTNRKTGNVTVDDKALSRLAKGTASRAPLKIAKEIQTYRSLKKLHSTYLDIELDPDLRFRCSYNPRGTTTGRLSSSATLFKTGTNQQNLPEQFKQFLVADIGHIFVEIDKTQAEWVVVAYYGGDANMIEVIEKHLDPHSRTGSLMTGIEDLDLIKREAKLIGHSTDPDFILSVREENFPELLEHQKAGGYLPRVFSIRQCGKHSNHGLNYAMGYVRFALEYEIPETESKMIIDRYHYAYPGIRSGYHARIDYLIGRSRTLENCFGRKRVFYGRKGPELLNKAYDFIAQSTVADLVNRSLRQIYKDRSELFLPLKLLAQTHDSILFEYPINNIELLAQINQKCLAYMNPIMSYHGRDFQIGSDIKIGLNWRDMVEVKNGADPEELARIISSLH